jgi:hypothetical protein
MPTKKLTKSFGNSKTNDTGVSKLKEQFAAKKAEEGKFS